MKPVWEEHTFAVCAYKESPYLENCIQSLLKQRMKSKICMCTATPNDYIYHMAEKYDIPVFINNGECGIGEDWNFAMSCCDTRYVTLAHQDDIYKENYTWEIRKALKRAAKPLILFSGYHEIREGREISKNRLLRVKRLMLAPLRLRKLQGSRFVRRRILSLGNAICCPSVTYVRENLPEPIFVPGMRSNLDWDAWERISRLDGEFVYLYQALMCHRIHEESETSAIIGDGRRTEEDYTIFRQFWPKWIARIVAEIYKKGEKSNNTL